MVVNCYLGLELHAWRAAPRCAIGSRAETFQRPRTTDGRVEIVIISTSWLIECDHDISGKTEVPPPRAREKSARLHAPRLRGQDLDAVRRLRARFDHGGHH